MVSNSGRNIGAVVFDLDGVIINSRRVIEEAWRSVAIHHGRVLGEHDLEHHVHGRSGAETVKILFPESSETDRSYIWAEVDKIEESAAYAQIPGVSRFILELKRNRVLLGIATSSWPAKLNNVLRESGFGNAFAAFVTRDDVAEGKPHPETYLAISRILKVSADNVLVFEDSPSGVASAIAAGATCIGIGGPDLLELGAVAAIPDFLSLRLKRVSPEMVSLGGAGMAGVLSITCEVPASAPKPHPASDDAPLSRGGEFGT